MAGEEELGGRGKSSFSEEGKTTEADEVGSRALLPATCNSINVESSGVAADVQPLTPTAEVVKGVLRESPSEEPGGDPSIAGNPGKARVPRKQDRDRQTAGTDVDSGLEKPLSKRRKVDSTPHDERPTLNQRCQDLNGNSTVVPSHVLQEPHQSVAACMELGEKELALPQDTGAAELTAPGPLREFDRSQACAPDMPDEASLQVS